ncbi:MAG: cation:proton antiporter [Bacteroidetes bacterium]|nr:cation:proton antiporter [Bacteroidota bacterium]
MDKYEIIKEIVIILAVSLPIIFLFKKIKISSVVGLLVTGVLIGPFGLGLIAKPEEIEVIAEIGVVLLMFTIGLEFSLEKLIKMKRLLLISGGMQLISTILLSALCLSLFQIPIKQAIFYGVLIALSSTVIVLKILSDDDLLDTPQGKLSVNILIFQDISIVPLFIFIPLLAEGNTLNLLNIVEKIGTAVIILTAIIAVSKFLVPKILLELAKTRIKEIFIMGVLLLLFGTAYLTETAGLSLSIGAFIAGVILTESKLSHQVVADITPIKVAFNSIFFVSIGMLLNTEFLLRYPLEVLLISISIILLKSVIIALIVMFLKYPLRIAIIAGLTLSQIGEFSFILAQTGKSYALIGQDYFNMFLGASIFTMSLTPFLIKYSYPIGQNIAKFFSKKDIEPFAEPEIRKISGHVIIAGFGLNGRNLAKVLKETGIRYTIIDTNPDTVLYYKNLNEHIHYGDVTQSETLIHAGAELAKIIVFAISDPRATERALQMAKEINPNIISIVRTRFVSETEKLEKLGADEIIPEEFETSLQIFRTVLIKYHIPLNIIMKQINLIRAESYKMLRNDFNVEELIHLDEILAQNLTETFYVTDENTWKGKSLREINIRAETGATVIAIVRDKKPIANPSGDEILKTGDTIVITGTHQQVDDTVQMLNRRD